MLRRVSRMAFSASACAAANGANQPRPTTAVGPVTTSQRRASGTCGLFANIPLSPPDMILGLSRDFARDADPKKVNLAVGVYRDEAGKPYVLDCVKKASAKLSMDSMDYAPITGLPPFVHAAERICYGDELLAANRDRVGGMQSLSGTGALRVGAQFLKRFGTNTIYVPSPTYPNHTGIFGAAGLELKSYPYYNLEKHTLELEGMLVYFDKLPENSVVLLHACAHNPTGFDPSPEQWRVIVDVLVQRRLVPFVDMAYQGFATGDLERDAYLPRLLLREKCPVFFLAQSFAKNFGLYGQRTGALHVCCETHGERGQMLSQLSTIIRAMYSNPPLYGAQIVDTIVRDPELYALWLKELASMSTRMSTIRRKLYDALLARGVTRPLQQIKDGHGMMALSGMSSAEVKELITKHHVYMVNNGRIALSGLTESNLDYVADCMTSVINKKG